MTEASCFADLLREEICQGDVYSGIPFSTPALPITHLTKETIKGGRTAWLPAAPPILPAHNQPSFGLFVYRIGMGMIISHNCAIDKPNENSRVLTAAVREATALDQRTELHLRAGKTRALMFLPGLKKVGDCYVDLRTITAIPRNLFETCPRIASLNDEAVTRLTVHIVTYLTDLVVPG